MDPRAPRRFRFPLLALAALVLAPSAWAGDDGGAEPVPDPEPLTEERCEELRATLATALGAEATLHRVPLQDPAGERTGFACEVRLTGTGEDFGHFLDAARRAGAALEEQGWREDERYLADGPTGTATGYRDDDGALALLHVRWDPADEAACPDDEPIGFCEVAPRHQEFTITLTAAREDAPGGVSEPSH